MATNKNGNDKNVITHGGIKAGFRHHWHPIKIQ